MFTCNFGKKEVNKIRTKKQITSLVMTQDMLISFLLTLANK